MRWLASIFAGALACAGIAAPLQFWAVAGSVEDAAMLRGLAQDFKEETGIEVEVTPLAWGDFRTKYFAAMAAGLPPDCGLTNLGGPFEYGAVGGLYDFRTELGPVGAALEKEFRPELLPMFTVEDRLYGVPSDLSTLAVFYRTDIFERLGIQPPRTWSELNRAYDQLEADGWQTAFSFIRSAQWAMGNFTMPYGLPSIGADESGRAQVNWLNPEYQKGVHFALMTWSARNLHGADLQSRQVGLFRSNDRENASPMVVDITYFGESLRRQAPELEGKWAAIPWPRADDGEAHNVMGGTAYVVFRKSKRPEDAARWIAFLSRRESQNAMILDRLNRREQSSLTMSSVQAVWGPQNDEFWSRPELAPYQQARQVLAASYQSFATTASTPGSNDAGRIEQNLIDKVGAWIRGQVDAEAQKAGLSRAELFREMGSGRLDAVRKSLEDRSRKKLAEEYEAAAPAANAALAAGQARYDRELKGISERAAELEGQLSVLDFAKWGAFALILAGGLAVALKSRLREHFWSYAFVAPPLALALIFVFVPAAAALWISLTAYHPALPLASARWVGLENFAHALGSADFWASLGRTVLFGAVTVPIGMGFSLLLAYALSMRPRAESVWRFLFFAPLVTSIVSVALIFTQLFLSGKQGWLNGLLLGLGWIREAIPFLETDQWFMPSVMVLAIWHGLAFTILIFLAGMQQIPGQIYEAAEVDGAGLLRRFRHVALPGVRPQIFFISIMGFIGSMQVFEPIYILAGKSGNAEARFGPNDSGLTLAPLIYREGFETFRMGEAAAYSYLLFAIVLVLSLVQLRWAQRGENS